MTAVRLILWLPVCRLFLLPLPQLSPWRSACAWWLRRKGPADCVSTVNIDHNTIYPFRCNSQFTPERLYRYGNLNTHTHTHTRKLNNRCYTPYKESVKCLEGSFRDLCFCSPCTGWQILHACENMMKRGAAVSSLLLFHLLQLTATTIKKIK